MTFRVLETLLRWMVLRNKFQIGDITKIALIATLMLTLISGAAVAESGSGDIDVQAEDADGNYGGDIALYDNSDQVVKTVTADQGEALFEDVEHGDYYLEAQDSTGATVQSQTFSHENDVTNVEWDIENNSLTVSGEDNTIEYVAPTPENAADLVQNPSLGVFLGMVIIGVAFLAVFGLSGFILLAILSRVR